MGEPKKPLSKRKTGLAIAALAGIPGGPIGILASPLILYLLTLTLKGKNGKEPNRFIPWFFIGIIGVPLCLLPFLGSSERVTEKRKDPLITNNKDQTAPQAKENPPALPQTKETEPERIIPLRTTSFVREDRAMIVLDSKAYSSIIADNDLTRPVESKGGALVAVYMMIANTGKESGDMRWTTFKLIDNQGRKYSEIEDFSESVAIGIWLEEQGFADPRDQLFPGGKAKIAKVFRVNPGAEGLRLLVNGDQVFAITKE